MVINKEINFTINRAASVQNNSPFLPDKVNVMYILCKRELMHFTSDPRSLQESPCAHS